MKPFCAAVDWGTSHIRVWLIGTDGEVLASDRGEEGVTRCAAGQFAVVLEKYLQMLNAPATLPVVICGMAGSQRGWIETPYRTIPANLDELKESVIEVPDCDRPVAIVTGLAQRSRSDADVMRGEETQLLGVFDDEAGNAVACIPGTHSKWVSLSAGRVHRFTTYMTGDLYAAICEHTILARDGEQVHDDGVFADGVRAAFEAPQDLTSGLFAVRGRELLGYAAPRHARSAISGLLIGTELASAKAHGLCGTTVSLIASGQHADRYGEAMKIAGMGFVTIDAETAAVCGLYRVAKNWRAPHAQK